MSSQPRSGGRMSLTSNMQAQQNSRGHNGDFLKLSRANIQSNIHNYNQYSRNRDDDNMSELSVPIYDNMSVASRRTPRSSQHGFEDDNVSMVSSVFTKQEISDVIPNDIKRFLNTFQNSKQDRMYRSKFTIPQEFDIYYYLLRYPRFGNIRRYTFKNVVGLYKLYDEKASTIYGMDDKYFRLKYSIPDNLDVKCYLERYPTLLEKNNIDNTDVSVYKFFDSSGQYDYILDSKYYQILMQIHRYFDIHTLIQRHKGIADLISDIDIDDDIDVYEFYNSLDKEKYVLDDTYFRLRFDIHETFDSRTYLERYQEVNEISKLKSSDTCDMYAYYHKKGIHDFALDEKYYQIKYNVSSEFDWNHYGEAFVSCFDHKDDSKNMSKMFFLYSNDFHKKYDSKLYDHYLVLKNDLSLIDIDLYKKIFLFMLDSSKIDDEYVYQFCDWNITYDNIYGGMMNGIVKDDRKFRTSMSFILRKTNFTSEKDIRRYIYLHEFYNSEYYVDGETLYPTTKIVGKEVERRVITTTPESRVRLVPRSQANPNCIINKPETDIIINDRQIIDDAINISNPEKNEIDETLSVAPDYGSIAKINFSGIKQKIANMNNIKYVNEAAVKNVNEAAVKNVNEGAVVAAVSVETNGQSRISSAIEQLTNAVKNNQDISKITRLLQDKEEDKDEDVCETLDLKNVNQNVSKSKKRGQRKRK